tara:strand:- start:138 stop:497 length:360 start_codon:yes stop_codon:yes gene_type:complete
MDELKLSDKSIGHIAKMLQVALLTGTDLVDNLRLIGFQDNDGKLEPHPNHADSFEKSLTVMIEEANSQQLKAVLESGNLPEGLSEEEANNLLASYNDTAVKAAKDLNLLGAQSIVVEEQ